MSFATINGWVLPIAINGARSAREQEGGPDRGWTGRPNVYRYGMPRRWSVTTSKMSHGDADTLEALLDGRGHHIPLNGDFYSTAGLVPQGGTAAFSFPGWTAEPPVHGRSHLSITSGNIIWNPGFIDGKWTVMYWRGADLGVGYGNAVHVVVRSDGAKWENGVRNDVLTTSEMTVSNGAVSFGVEEYDDIVLLPYAAVAGMIESFYLWTTAHALSAYVPMDNLGREVIGGVVATDTGTVVFAETADGGYADLQDASARLAYGTSPGFDVASVGDVDGFTVEAWINLDTLASDAVVLDHVSASLGWTLQVTTVGKVSFTATRATTDTEVLSQTGDVPLSAWTHVAAVMNPATLRATIYVNGLPVSPSTDIQGDGALDSDTAAVLYVGNNAGSANAIDGKIAGVRIMQRAATAAEVLERYRRGRGKSAPVRMPFPDLPYLNLCGDIVDNIPTIVLGSSSGQSVVQHGSSTGWVDNAREISGEMDEIIHEEVSRSAPDVGYIMDSKYITGTTIYAVHGPHSGTLQGGVLADGRQGPFGHGQSIVMSDASTHRILLSTAERDGLSGARAVTVATWVRKDTSVNSDVLLHYTVSGTTALLGFDDGAAGGALRIGARAYSGDTFRNLEHAYAFDDGEWHHLAGFVDLANGQLALYVDGAQVAFRQQSGVGSGNTNLWAQPRFSDEQTGNSYIGADGTPANSFNGDIAKMLVWYRRLDDAEILNDYLSGLSGDFR